MCRLHCIVPVTDLEKQCLKEAKGFKGFYLCKMGCQLHDTSRKGTWKQCFALPAQLLAVHLDSLLLSQDVVRKACHCTKHVAALHLLCRCSSTMPTEIMDLTTWLQPQIPSSWFLYLCALTMCQKFLLACGIDWSSLSMLKASAARCWADEHCLKVTPFTLFLQLLFCPFLFPHTTLNELSIIFGIPLFKNPFIGTYCWVCCILDICWPEPHLANFNAKNKLISSG